MTHKLLINVSIVTVITPNLVYPLAVICLCILLIGACTSPVNTTVRNELNSTHSIEQAQNVRSLHHEVDRKGAQAVRSVEGDRSADSFHYEQTDDYVNEDNPGIWIAGQNNMATLVNGVRHQQYQQTVPMINNPAYDEYKPQPALYEDIEQFQPEEYLEPTTMGLRFAEI